VYGEHDILKYLNAKFSKDVVATSATQEWVEFALKQLSIKDFKILNPALEKLESHLNFRSFVVGYSITVADIAVWGVLRANPVMGSVIKSGNFINISRWYKYFELHPCFGAAVEQMNKSVTELRKQEKSGQKKEVSKASYDIDLIDAVDGQVVTRFPPEPSGYLHIGHAKAAILNQYFAQMYHGKLIIRFDDTNPSKEKVEFTQAIIEDLDLLGIKGDRITHSSDYFQEMYDLAVRMIKEGKAYCDDTVQEKMREERGEGIASARRNRSVEENLRVFEEMSKGTEEGLKNCVRAKISVDAPNKTLRDPVIYRCNLTPHHRTGDKWKVYPTYDFCCPVVDAIEGVTHALRTIEYRDRNAQYEWMLKALNLRKVHVWDFSRINFVRTLLSKRKLQWFVDTGKVANWDDPRFPTVRGVRRRGMSVEGLRNFIISQGPSKNILNLDWSLIWASNKKVIDPIAPRHCAVYKDAAVPVIISGGPTEPVTELKPKHKKNPDLGDKKIIYSSRILIDQDDAKTLKDNEEFTLMDWGNAIVTAIRHKDDVVTEIEVKLHLEGDFKKTEKKISWLADTTDLVPVELIDFDHLITKEKIEEGENFEDYLTPETEFHTAAVADVNIKDLAVGAVIQFERKGYYRLDTAYSEGHPALFFTVPDGKVVSKYGVKST
jgi:glutamyl-tRNA synthetase